MVKPPQKPSFISYIPVCFLLFSTGGSHHPAIGLGMEDLAEMVDALVSVGETAHLKANSFHWGISWGISCCTLGSPVGIQNETWEFQKGDILSGISW
jgi:hypothetical protein